MGMATHLSQARTVGVNRGRAHEGEKDTHFIPIFEAADEEQLGDLRGALYSLDDLYHIETVAPLRVGGGFHSKDRVYRIDMYPHGGGISYMEHRRLVNEFARPIYWDHEQIWFYLGAKTYQVRLDTHRENVHPVHRFSVDGWTPSLHPSDARPKSELLRVSRDGIEICISGPHQGDQNRLTYGAP